MEGALRTQDRGSGNSFYLLALFYVPHFHYICFFAKKQGEYEGFVKLRKFSHYRCKEAAKLPLPYFTVSHEAKIHTFLKIKSNLPGRPKGTARAIQQGPSAILYRRGALLYFCQLGGKTPLARLAASPWPASELQFADSIKWEAMAPSATAVTTWRKGLRRTSPTAKTPGMFVRVVSSAST